MGQNSPVYVIHDVRGRRIVILHDADFPAGTP
jgi:hypothetical protein